MVLIKIESIDTGNVEKFAYNNTTKASLLMIYDNIGMNQKFGSKEMTKILECVPSTAALMMKKLRDMKIIIEIKDKGKVKYSFKNQEEILSDARNKTMLKIKSTKNNTGITISGDYEDLNALYECMGDLTGFECAYERYEGVLLNCLGFAYDIRHAFMGDREVAMIDNGVHDEMQRWHGMIMPKKNIYYSVNILWPQAMFVVLAMNDYIELASDPKAYAKVLAGLPEESVVEQKNRLPYSVAVVKLFQTLVWQAFREVVGENRYTRIYKKTVNEYTFVKKLEYRGFCTQYIDDISVKYIGTAVEKRQTKLAACIRSIVEKSKDYYDMERSIRNYATLNNVTVTELRLEGVEYPEEIEW